MELSSNHSSQAKQNEVPWPSTKKTSAGNVPLPAQGSLGDTPEDARTVATITFNDGSTYTGTVKGGLPDGIGTCIWRDGNKYDGEWRTGLMHGFGTYIWTSGQRYDGEWKDGKREGMGIKVYADGSTYDGFWREGRKHGIGVFRPAPPEPPRDRVGSVAGFAGPLASLRRLGTGVRSTGGLTGASPLPGASTHSVTGTNNPQPSEMSITQLSSGTVVDGVVGTAVTPVAREKADLYSEILLIREFDNGKPVREDPISREELKQIFGPIWQSSGKRKKVKQRVKKAFGIGKRLQQKQGKLVFKSMPAYELMINLQLGIRHSVGRENQAAQRTQSRELPLASTGLASTILDPHSPPAKLFKEKIKVRFPRSGSSTTPAHPSSDFKWKDYAPQIFHLLRGMYGINEVDYMLSLGGTAALWQLNSPGKSGCMFFLSDDERFLIKTTRKDEVHALLDMLPRYYAHLAANKDTLITRFFGVHAVKPNNGRNVRFVVMSNIFCTDLHIHRKFDLKGSTEGRTSQGLDPNDPKSVFKDLDLDFKLSLDPAKHNKLVGILKADSDFLQSMGVMDYSLLLGIHYSTRRREDSGLHSRVLHSNAAGSPGPPGARMSRIEENQDGNGQLLSAQMLEEEDDEEGEEAVSGMAAQMDMDSPRNQAPMLGEHATELERSGNFEYFDGQKSMAIRLAEVEARLRELGASERRMLDVMELARLHILGDKIKRRKSRIDNRQTPSLLLKAMSMARMPAEETSGAEAASDEDASSLMDGATALAKQLAYNLPAIATSKKAAGGGGDEVRLYFGIIDILQTYNARKALERAIKSITADPDKISVAPPALYASRFLNFMSTQVFVKPERGLDMQMSGGSL